MRKINYALLLFFLLIFGTTEACDICGCGNNGNYIGILPEFHKNIVGIRYRQNSLRTHIGNNGMDTYLTNKETYSAYEFWSSIKIAKNFHLSLTVPYNFSTKKGLNENQVIKGLGDVNLMAFYTLFQSNKLTKSSNVFIQSLSLSAGIKLPTGLYQQIENASSSQLFTLGTGTYDFSIGGIYEARLQNTGLNITTNFKMNSFNRFKYQYGNRFQFNTQIYHKFFVIDKLSIAPNTGIQLEINKKDFNKNNIVNISGGSLLNGIIGMECKINNILIGFNSQHPLYQNIANNMISSTTRNMVHLSFSF